MRLYIFILFFLKEEPKRKLVQGKVLKIGTLIVAVFCGVTYVNVLAFFMQNSFLFPNKKICPLNLL